LRKSYLDAVRACAAFLVVVVHTGQFFPAPNQAIQLLAAMGQLGVQLFFVLSAFLIFESLDRLRGRASPLTEFFVHRFLRIAPLYYTAIVVFLVTFGALLPALGYSSGPPAACTPQNILANVLFLNGLVPDANNSIVGGGWSVGTEMLFYLLAPMLFLLRKRWPLLIVVAALCYPTVLWLVRLGWPSLGAPGFVYDNHFLYFSIANQLPVFICGCLLYAFKDRAFAIPAIAAAFGWVASIAAAGYIWETNFSGTMTFFYIPLLAGISSAFFIVLMSRVQVSNRLVLEFGRRAFSIYMFNLPALLLVQYGAGRLGLKLPVFIALLFVATTAFLMAGVTYRFVERPFLNLSKRLSFPLFASAQHALPASPTVSPPTPAN
jgi:peptidoglycan/LPS O-acetylase OafA/YrhL